MPAEVICFKKGVGTIKFLSKRFSTTLVSSLLNFFWNYRKMLIANTDMTVIGVDFIDPKHEGCDKQETSADV